MYMKDGLHLSGKGAAIFVDNSQQQETVAWVAYQIFLVVNVL